MLSDSTATDVFKPSDFPFVKFSQVLKSTGFFEGLFEEEELVSDNVKDRESKILFLHKVISVVGKCN